MRTQVQPVAASTPANTAALRVAPRGAVDVPPSAASPDLPWFDRPACNADNQSAPAAAEDVEEPQVKATLAKLKAEAHAAAAEAAALQEQVAKARAEAWAAKGDAAVLEMQLSKAAKQGLAEPYDPYDDPRLNPDLPASRPGSKSPEEVELERLRALELQDSILQRSRGEDGDARLEHPGTDEAGYPILRGTDEDTAGRIAALYAEVAAEAKTVTLPEGGPERLPSLARSPQSVSSAAFHDATGSFTTPTSSST